MDNMSSHNFIVKECIYLQKKKLRKLIERKVRSTWGGRWSKRQLDERKTGKGIHWKDKKDLKVKVKWFKYGIGS